METDKINEYGALNTISGILKGLGYVVTVMALIALLVAFFNEKAIDLAPILAIGAIASLMPAMLLIAFAEIIKVLVRIEINTRKEPVQMATKKNLPFEKTPDTEPFEEWAKKNPTKTRNDYYASRQKNH